MQSKDTKAQCVMWHNLNKVMANNGVPNKVEIQTLKRFMANNAQVDWNVVQIVHGSRNPSELMVDRGQTCFFHWNQLDRHKIVDQAKVAKQT